MGLKIVAHQPENLTDVIFFWDLDENHSFNMRFWQTRVRLTQFASKFIKTGTLRAVERDYLLACLETMGFGPAGFTSRKNFLFQFSHAGFVFPKITNRAFAEWNRRIKALFDAAEEFNADSRTEQVACHIVGLLTGSEKGDTTAVLGNWTVYGPCERSTEEIEAIIRELEPLRRNTANPVIKAILTPMKSNTREKVERQLMSLKEKALAYKGMGLGLPGQNGPQDQVAEGALRMWNLSVSESMQLLSLQELGLDQSVQNGSQIQMEGIAPRMENLSMFEWVDGICGLGKKLQALQCSG